MFRRVLWTAASLSGIIASAAAPALARTPGGSGGNHGPSTASPVSYASRPPMTTYQPVPPASGPRTGGNIPPNALGLTNHPVGVLGVPGALGVNKGPGGLPVTTGSNPLPPNVLAQAGNSNNGNGQGNVGNGNSGTGTGNVGSGNGQGNVGNGNVGNGNGIGNVVGNKITNVTIGGFGGGFGGGDGGGGGGGGGFDGGGFSGVSVSPSPAVVADVAAAPAVNPIADAPGATVINPIAPGVTLTYAVNGDVHRLAPGGSENLPANALIEFDRGGDFGNARYSLAAGAYTFGITERGWDLFQGTAPSPASLHGSPAVTRR